MKKTLRLLFYLPYNKLVKFIIISLLFFSFKAFSVIGHDDRFYINKTKWADLFSGVFSVNNCTGFLVEGDVIIAAAHCFEYLYYKNKRGNWSTYPLVGKNSKIKLKKIRKYSNIRFGDAYWEMDGKIEKEIFNERSIKYQIKDIFLAHNPSVIQLASSYDIYAKDYAFIKLNKEIPKKIKRFKIFNSDLLKEYEILKHPDRGNLSIVAYHADNDKTWYQRMAHLGCKARDLRKYKKAWIEGSDCDVYGGASGAPIFYILRHKKTRKIELAVRSIAVGVSDSIHPRKMDAKTKKYSLGFGNHYYSSVLYPGSTISLLITNHKEFLSNLEKFKKEPSFFRDKKVANIKYNKYMDEKWILKHIVQKKTLKELIEFIEKDLAPLEFKLEVLENFEISDLLKKIAKDKKSKISKEKRKLLKKYFIDFAFNDIVTNDSVTYDFIVSYYQRKFYPYKKRVKKFSFEKISELTHPDRKKPIPFEDSVDDKIKAQKLWKIYFSK